MEEVVRTLDEAIDYIDKIEALVSRLKPGDTVQAGLVYQIYELLVLTRERVVEARLKLRLSQ